MAIAPPAEPHLRDVSSARIITRGYFRMLNFFDIAEAIDLEQLRILLGPHRAPLSRFRPSHSRIRASPESSTGRIARASRPAQRGGVGGGDRVVLVRRGGRGA